MGIFDWIKKGVDIDGGSENGKAEQNHPPLDDDAYRRKQAFDKLVHGDSPPPSPQVDGKRTVQVYLIKTNQDLAEVIKKLKNNEPSIVDLSRISKAEIERTQDFLSGVVFALEAHISSFQENMFLITPKGVKIY